MFNIYRLPNMIEGEAVVKMVRRDVFILIKKIGFCLLLTIVPLLILYMAITTYTGLFESEFVTGVAILFLSGYYLFVWLFFFFTFIDYYLDAWIITSERIIDIHQNGFFSRTISEQRLNRIQDVTSETKGFLPTVFKYGEVYVQTAGETQRFNFYQIPNPDDIRDLIIKQSEVCKRKHADDETLKSSETPDLGVKLQEITVKN